MVFKADKNFVTKVAERAYTAPQLLRQFCPLGKTVFTVQAIVMTTGHWSALGENEWVDLYKIASLTEA